MLTVIVPVLFNEGESIEISPYASSVNNFSELELTLPFSSSKVMSDFISISDEVHELKIKAVIIQTMLTYFLNY